MSVTFFCPDAPMHDTFPFEDDPTYAVPEPDEPFVEINMSNSNACAMLDIIDPVFTEDLCGSWEGDRLEAVHKRIFMLLNKNPEKLISETVVEGNFIMCGRDSEYVSRRLREMLQLTSAAIQYGYVVNFG